MPKSIAALFSLLTLCGCATAYGGSYATSSCGLTKSQSIDIADELSRSLGVASKTTTDYQGYRATVIELPAERGPRSAIVPYARVLETDHGVFIGIGDNGDGTSPLSKKLRDIVQQTLSRHGCSSWTFKGGTYDPEKYL